MKKRILFWILLLLSLGVLSGCGGDEQAEAETPVEVVEEDTIEEVAEMAEEVVLEGVNDGILNLSMNVPTTLNPLLNEEESVNRILRLIFEPLITLDASGKPAAGIATSWAYQGDGTTISLELQQGILWQNGSELTANDVAYSLETIGLSGENSVYHGVLEYISGYRVTGSYSIDIDFYEAFSGNIYALQFPVISSSYYGGSETTPTTGVNMYPMGSGAYMMTGYTMASSMELKANPYYINGVANIENIKVQITNSDTTDVYAFEQGMMDAVVMTAIGTGRYAEDNGIQIYNYPTRKYDFATFQFADVRFQNKDMRKAFAYALPREYIKESIYLNYADTAYTPISPKSWLYEENVMNYEYDKQMAATLLKNSGWADADGDGILEDAEGNPLVVSLLVNEENTPRMQIATKWKEELQLLGVSVNLEVQPYEVYAQKVRDGNFEMLLGGWEMSATMNLYDFFGVEGQYNYTGYNDETTEALIAEVNAAVGEGATLLAYSDLQKRIAEELPYISIAYRQDGLFLSSAVGGDISPVVDDVYTGIADWHWVN